MRVDAASGLSLNNFHLLKMVYSLADVLSTPNTHRMPSYYRMPSFIVVNDKNDDDDTSVYALQCLVKLEFTIESDSSETLLN